MKIIATLSFLAVVGLTASGCLVYERRPPSREVVVETTPGVRETVITTLPSGYRTRVYRGTTYYYTRNVVYRSYPRGGYVVVPSPW